MPYQYGFLTSTLKEHLKRNKSDMNSKTRAIYNFHVRSHLKQALKDGVFVLEKLDKDQFDKIAEETKMLLVELISTFAERSVEPYGKYPYGRIHDYKLLKYFMSKKEGDVLMDINMKAFDRIYGKRKKQKDG